MFIGEGHDLNENRFRDEFYRLWEIPDDDPDVEIYFSRTTNDMVNKLGATGDFDRAMKVLGRRDLNPDEQKRCAKAAREAARICGALCKARRSVSTAQADRT